MKVAACACIGALASALLLAATLVACTHDFGQFENGTESSEAGVDGGPDGACNPDVACTNNAKSCGSQCKMTESKCEDDCGSGKSCKSNCQDAGASCDNSCVGYCMTCAGCNARAACQNALQ
ncbi:MAG: hypothetical protein ACRELY_11940 [Polyangiaceae bacterium]